MNSLRHPPPDPRHVDDVSLCGVVGLGSGSAGSAGAAETEPGLPEPTAEFELWATGPGLVIGAVPEPGSGSRAGAARPVPDLIPWSLVCSVDADGVTARADGSRGEILEICLSDGGWSVGDRVQRFVAPTVGLGAFLLVASSHRQLTTTSRPAELDEGPAPSTGPVAATAAAWRSLKARWTGGERSDDGNDPRHGLGRRRIGPIAVGGMAVLLLAGSGTVIGSVGASSPLPSASRTGDPGNGVQAVEHRSADLAAATTKPKPAPPSLAGSPALRSHEMFGYAPYWTLPESSGFDVKDLTTLAYFSVDANANGTLDESGPGWNGYQSQDLVNLVNRSHAAGDRVVLTVTDFNQSSLDAITSDPAAPARLSAALIAAVAAKNLDGVNFDFEGEGSGDQNGLTHLVTQVSHALRAANPHWQVTMATYASAAGDPGGFYNIAALAPAVDGFFIMAYDMNNELSPGATAPLTGAGFTDAKALQQFTSVVPASKVILGVPFYGYDWPTDNGSMTAKATGPESPLSDGVITASGHPTYWDSITKTAWTSYKVGNQWHETFFDNPTSLALKARLANSFHIAGMGIWALGMDGNNPAMLTALLGDAPAAKDYSSGPTNTSASGSSTTAPPGTGYVTIGVWQGGAVPLGPLTQPATDGSAQYLGTLSRFTTSDPALACLETGPPLEVWSFSSLPGEDVVVASQPQDCAAALFRFRPGKRRTDKRATTTTTTTTPPTTTSTSSTTTTTTSTSTTTTVPSTTTTTSTSTTTTTSTSTTTTTTTVPPTTTTTSTTSVAAVSATEPSG
jgi:hypothetical protein